MDSRKKNGEKRMLERKKVEIVLAEGNATSSAISLIHETASFKSSWVSSRGREGKELFIGIEGVIFRKMTNWTKCEFEDLWRAAAV